MAKSPAEMLATMVANLAEKTGRPLESWIEAVRARGAGKHGEIVAWLKQEHAMGHGYANLVASKVLEAPNAPAGDDLVAAQYAGSRAALRPIWQRIAAEVAEFGSDVELAPKKGYVSLRRGKQFGLVQPSTATRIDVGIQLPGAAASGRLEASGSFNAMVSHRVRVASVTEVDAELLGWLRAAYDRA